MNRGQVEVFPVWIGLVAALIVAVVVGYSTVGEMNDQLPSEPGEWCDFKLGEEYNPVEEHDDTVECVGPDGERRTVHKVINMTSGF